MTLADVEADMVLSGSCYIAAEITCCRSIRAACEGMCCDAEALLIRLQHKPRFQQCAACAAAAAAAGASPFGRC